MRRVFLLLLLLFPTLAFAQRDWVSYPDEGCIGGSTCADRRLRVGLEDRPVIGIRFHAHDSIGEKAEGVLRVKIDGNTVDSYVDVPRAGKTFTIDVDSLSGRYLVFEPATNDEVKISHVEVLYGRNIVRRPPDRWDHGPSGGPSGGTGWRSYPNAKGCIGGDECRRNGTRIMVALEDAPVLGVRFYAHDNVGTRADGKLSVRIDSNSVGSYVDVQRNGKLHEFEVDNVRGTRLVIETSNDDEVEIKDVEVLYGRGGGRRGGSGGNWQREATNEGGCIGGSECGGRRARIRVPIYGRTVGQIRFYARDDVGTRAGGELRIRIDDEVIQDYLDITREGRTYTFDGRGIAGDYLIFEPAEDDEVVVRDIRVTFVPD
jgi:hypothetical protein